MAYSPASSSNPLVKPYRMLYISSIPYDATGHDTSFFCLGSVQSFSYTNTSNGSTTGIVSRPTNEAIYMDSVQGASGRISVTTLRIVDDGYKNNGTTYNDGTSNAQALDKLRRMKELPQMQNNSYILRVYNAVLTESPTSYREVNVFIERFDYDLAMERPWEISLNITFVVRNRGVGFS